MLIYQGVDFFRLTEASYVVGSWNLGDMIIDFFGQPEWVGFLGDAIAVLWDFWTQNDELMICFFETGTYGI